ncbi:MAG: iron ABC transporter permease [Prevotella sp.]|jgi:iron complex transport system permease protein|nr:iron ABC transporter permease [Prevotella sp.]
MKRTTTPDILLLSLLLLALLLATLVSFSVGRYPLPVADILRYVFTGEYSDENLPVLLTDIRLPRIAAAILAGGALSVSGAAYQGLFRNPVVSPDILGVSQGAGFGAALAIILSLGTFAIQASSFAMGIFSVCMALSISRIMSRGHDKILMLVLSGMIVGAMFGSLISLMKYVADSEYKLPDITFWLMGSLTGITMDEIALALPVIVVSLVPMFLFAWKLNVLSFGDEEARAMGVNTGRLRFLLIACASLLTASVVCITGLIGWVGLIIPHLARFIVGPNHRALFPASFLLGGTFLLLVDDLARSISSLEVPLGIITSIIGAPMFFIILRMTSKKTF